MEIKGDIRVRRTLVADRRADQGLNSAVITGTETLVRHSAYWQALSAAAEQDVILPDGTTLPNGWTVVIQASGAAELTVKNDTAGTEVTSIASGKAKRLILTDNGSADGTWFIEDLEAAGDVAAQRYTLTHDATTDWGSPADDYYSIATAASVHGRGTRPMVQFYETVGSDEIEVAPDQSKFATASGDHTFRVPATPDLRYAGKVIFI